MASIIKRGKRYQIRFLNRHGRWKKMACKAATASEAQRLADDKERVEEKIRLGVLRAVAPDMRFKEALPLYFSTLRPDYASRQSLEGRFRNRILPHLGEKYCREITPADVKLMLAKNSDCAPQTREHLRVAVQGVFTFLINDLKLVQGENPAGKVPKQKGPGKLPGFLQVHEIPRLMAQVPEQHLPVFLFGVGTGVRKGESLGLLKAEVDLVHRVAHMNHSHERDTTKGGIGRPVGIPPWLVPILRKHFESTASVYAFPGKNGERQPRWVALHKIMKTALKAAGLITGYRAWCHTSGPRKGCGFKEERQEKGEPICQCGKRLKIQGVPYKLTFHNLRHTFATWALAQGKNLGKVQDLLGHKDPRTTRVYAKVLAEHLTELTDSMDLGMGKKGTQMGHAGGLHVPLGDTVGTGGYLQLPERTLEGSL